MGRESCGEGRGVGSIVFMCSGLKISLRQLRAGLASMIKQEVKEEPAAEAVEEGAEEEAYQALEWVEDVKEGERAEAVEEGDEEEWVAVEDQGEWVAVEETEEEAAVDDPVTVDEEAEEKTYPHR